ncbi:hypothetical protein [Diaphorobacter aerolatus]|uniref:General secretion pathway protein GspN n=1 Tax=Diaphorobacter aerolatus TaxID=1288495 RepID=A0A7H0GNU5_9BURK|nr:hypothetical protein [Diaphorobacter aerolatus]QNP49961.1 hypothetical protein H9K75_08950 [Diaphorobacter aerolatus]
MTLSATRILGILILLLTLGLAAMWLKPDGSLRNVVWTPPQAVMPDLQFADPLPSSASKVDVGLFVETLERPLFSPSRRPPPPPPPKEEEKKAPPPDPFAGIHVFGLYGGGDSPSGMLAKVEGKVRMVAINDKLGAWTFKSIDDRDAIFESNGETKKLPLLTAKPAPVPKPVVAGGAPDGQAPQNSGNIPVDASAEERRAAMEEAQRERLRRRNEIRARAGARPVTQ